MSNSTMERVPTIPRSAAMTMTGLVADRLGRDALLVELNAEYAEMAHNRIQRHAPLFGSVETAA